LAVDTAGNLFIGDDTINRVRKVTAGGVISIVAGKTVFPIPGFSGDCGPATSAQLEYPNGLAVDSAGDLFIADQVNHRVRKVTLGGVISTVAGNGTSGFSGDCGPAGAAQLNGPTGIAVDTAGNLYISDGSSRVRRVAGGPSVSMNLTLNAGGNAAWSTAGLNGTTQTGYAILAVNSGAAPYGTAVFSFK
jgi:sugar lactone lactonase YvrE